MQEGKNIKILRQILIIALFVSAFFLAAMCSPAVSVRRNYIVVFFTWFLTLALLKWYWEEQTKRTLKSNKETRSEWLRENKEIAAVLLFIFGGRILISQVMPRGDAAIYYRCLVNACRNFNFSLHTFFEQFRLAGHPTLGYAFFMGIGEFLLPGKLQGYMLINLLLTVTAAYCLYKLMGGYLMNAPKGRRAFYTLLVFSTPLFWGTFSYVNPDYAILLFFIFMLYTEYKKEYILMIFWLIVLCMTKETAVLVAGGYFTFRIIYAFCYGKYTLRERLKNTIQEKGTWLLIFGMLLMSAYVIRQGKLFAWDGMSLATLFGKEGYDGLFENRIEFRPEFAWNQLKLIFVLNFGWVYTLITLFGLFCIVRYRNTKTDGAEWNRTLAGIMGGFWAISIFLMLFLTAPLNRYHIFTAGIWPLVACILYENVIRDHFCSVEKKEIFLGAVLLFLLVGQTFRSIDPLSNISFERMDTGKMIMLETGGTFEDKYGDPMVNNYQYTWIDEELNTMLEGAAYDEDMLVIDAGMQRTAVKSGGSGGIRIAWNKVKNKREILWEDTENLVPIEQVSTRKMQERLAPDSEDAEHFYNKYIASRPRALVYFIKYYNEPEQEWLDYLGQYYKIGERKETNGRRGNIVYYELALKDAGLYGRDS